MNKALVKRVYSDVRDFIDDKVELLSRKDYLEFLEILADEIKVRIETVTEAIRRDK